jgi:MoaA/NifB/PqqE/SkfB family radical SAM enzyme
VGDFWNSGVAAEGRIAYARPGGYFYVNWNGNVTPCAFVPYYKDNIVDQLHEVMTPMWENRPGCAGCPRQSAA